MRFRESWPFIAFALLGVLATYLGLRVVRETRLSAAWPTAQGTIVSSRIERREDPDGDTRDRAVFVYEYVVGSTVHSGDTIAFGGFSVPPSVW